MAKSIEIQFKELRETASPQAVAKYEQEAAGVRKMLHKDFTTETALSILGEAMTEFPATTGKPRFGAGQPRKRNNGPGGFISEADQYRQKQFKTYRSAGFSEAESSIMAFGQVGGSNEAEKLGLTESYEVAQYSACRKAGMSPAESAVASSNRYYQEAVKLRTDRSRRGQTLEQLVESRLK